MSVVSAARRRVGAVAVVLALTGALSAVEPGSAEAAPSTGHTEVLTVGEDGSVVAGQPLPGSVSLSADGRYAAFATSAALDPADGAVEPGGNDSDVFVHDRTTDVTTLISSDAAGFTGYGQLSRNPSISATGRYVAFETGTPPGVDGPPIGTQIAVCDRDPDDDGVFDEPVTPGTAALASCIRLGRPPTAPGEPHYETDPSLSADGTVVVWDEDGLNAVLARLRRSETGTLTAPSTADYVDLIPTGQIDGGVSGSAGRPQVSADGEHAVLPVHLNSPFTYYATPAAARTVAPIAVGPIAVGPITVGPITVGPIGVGRAVAVPAETGTTDRAAVFALDLDTPIRSVRLDVDPNGSELGTGADSPVVSGDGAVVAFVVTGTDGTRQVEVVDRDPDSDGLLGPTNGEGGEPVLQTVASRAPGGGPGGGTDPALSTDGRYLAFATAAPGMHNGADRPIGGENTGLVTQVVARDLVVDARRGAADQQLDPGELLSVGTSACADDQVCGGNGASGGPALSADGAVTAFLSSATDLVGDGTTQPGPFTGGAYARVLEPVATATAVDFGAVTSGSSGRRDIAVTLQGSGPLTIDTVSITGADAGQFAVSAGDTCTATTRHAQDGCVVPVTFSPLGAGARRAALVLTAGGRTFSVPLSGDAIALPPPTTEPPVTTTTPPVPTTVPPVTTTEPPVTTTVAPTTVAPPPTVPPVTTTTTPVTTTAAPVTTTAPPTTAPAPVAPPTIPAPTPPPTTAPPVPVPGTAPAAVPPAAVAGPPAPVAAPANPVVTTSPGVVVAGRVITVTGTGFPADATVTIAVLAGVAPSPVTARTDARGAFSVAVTVFEHGPLGPGQVVVTAPPQARAMTPLLVVPGTYQPPGFVGRS